MRESSQEKGASAEQLKALPYVTWTDVSEEDVGKSGVTFYNESAAYPGVNIYCSMDTPSASFLDMSGETIHTINIAGGVGGCNLVGLNDHGILILLNEENENRTLFGVGWDSNIDFVKDKDNHFHHDFDMSDKGEIYVLSNSIENFASIDEDKPIVNTYLVVLSSEGNFLKKFSFARIFAKNTELINLIKTNSVKRTSFLTKVNKLLNSVIRILKDESIFVLIDKGYVFVSNWFDRSAVLGGKNDGSSANDIFHTNTLEIIDSDVDYGNGVVFKKGQILFCMRNQDLVGVIDIDKEELIWWWGLGELDKPHHPSLLDNGNILIFDNGYIRASHSRVLELDPSTGEIVWEYKADPPESFYSGIRGAAQRLPNGNTLITESEKGHVFEVTPEEEIVWEFWNPVVNNKNQRAVIYRMSRLTLDEWNKIKELVE